MNGITTCLWFDGQGQDAADFYVALFPSSRILSVSHYPEDGQRPAGSVLTVDFEIFGRPFMALNGGPQFTHSEAVSFQVFCDDQNEIDRVWDALTADGGQESMCGWWKDRFGVSWQVVPADLGALLAGDDPDGAPRAWAAMMQMRKLDIAALKRAYAGE
ncbi:MAG: VOC family protein [Actinobacteria bacterium]|nr:VOC family protein [Actinomycetota bacterium]